MNRRTIVTILLVAIAFAASFAAPTTSFAKLKVVATLSDLGWIAEQVGGDDAEVKTLCPGHQDPHYLPAKPSLARKMGKADLVVYNGLELEIGWLPLLIDSARNPRVRAAVANWIVRQLLTTYWMFRLDTLTVPAVISILTETLTICWILTTGP